MIDPGALGKYLLSKGFRVWFLYLFRYINGSPWTEETVHKKLFKQIERIIAGKSTRLCLNICPRAGKTTLAAWLVVYALTINPRSQIIYTSFNQDLLTQIAQQISGIMNHPIYQQMFGQMSHHETYEANPIDDFWRQYLFDTQKKSTFSNRKITTPQGGVVLFNSIGAAITGFGAGLRNATKFSGILILDDPDKPTDVRSETVRKKTHTYFVETLLSRLNSSTTPILIIQQRLHLDDMTGFLVQQYNYEVFKAPLLDENGNCNLGNQYTPERIKELQVDEYTFSAQYQQEPIMLGGGVLKHSWWRYYDDMTRGRYMRIFITADTANKTKEANDFTAIGVWGLTTQHRLRLLDMVHAKLEIPELRETFRALWAKWKQGIGTCRCSCIYIEDKASGTQVIQDLIREGIPVTPIQVEKDKYTRVQNVVGQIAAGNVELPENDRHPISHEFLAEADAFSADDTHLHDDMVDMMCHAVTEAFYGWGII